MRHQVSPAALNALERLLAGELDVPVAGGEIQFVCASLPGRAACISAMVGTVLFLVIDDAKPWARGQAAEMLASARAPADGVTQLQRIPVQGPRGHCHLEMVV